MDVPSAANYYEPYDASNASGYGAEPTTGYPEVKNNRTEEDQDLLSSMVFFSTETVGQSELLLTQLQLVELLQELQAIYAITVNDAADIKKETTQKALVFLQTPMSLISKEPILN